MEAMESFLGKQSWYRPPAANANAVATTVTPGAVVRTVAPEMTAEEWEAERQRQISTLEALSEVA